MFLSKPHYKKFYQLHFQDENGKWRKVSTGLDKKKDANKFKEEFKLKQFKEQQNQANLNLLQINTPLVFSKLAQEVLENNQTNLSTSTANIYKRTIREFIRITGDMRVKDLKLSHFEQYKEKRRTEIKDCTLNIEIRTLKRIFNLAIMYELIDRSPAKFLKQIPVGENEIILFKEHQFQTLINGISLEYFRDLVMFGYLTGCRLNELLTLQWSNIDFEDKVIYIGKKEGFQTKTRKNRKIPLTNELADILTKKLKENLTLLGSGKYIFPNPNGKPFNKSYIGRKFKYFIKRTGLPEKLHFHCLRHSAITRMLANGGSIVKVQKIVGHLNIKTTLGYTHLIVDDLRDTIELLSSKNDSKNSLAI